MAGKQTISGTILQLAVFIGLEAASLVLLTHNGAAQNFFFMKGVHAVMAWTWGLTESVSEYFSLKEENERLAEKVFTLNRQVLGLQSSLRNVHADSSASPVTDFVFIRADVVKMSTNSQHNYLIIGKGSADGIRPQSGVITSCGVAGIIDAVGRHYSYAISFLNSQISISARIGRNGAVGPMSWDGIHAGRALLKEIPLQHRFEAGDTVYTSGYSSIFPPDIPLGVTGERRIVNGATYEVSIRLFQDYSALRQVSVVRNSDMEEITALERQEDAS